MYNNIFFKNHRWNKREGITLFGPTFWKVYNGENTLATVYITLRIHFVISINND